MSKGYEWRRVAHWTASVMWRSGEIARAHVLFREVIRDARLEADETRDA